MIHLYSLDSSLDKYLPTAYYNESQLTYQKFGEWELINKSSRSEETPYQRYCRLKSEVTELANDLRCVDGWYSNCISRVDYSS